jgi:phosphatidylserine decarboxylase
MVRDGYYYGIGLISSAVVVGWLTSPGWAAIPVVLAAFFLWFFRDPERFIPPDPGVVVSPADGRVTDIGPVVLNGERFQRISIFLNVFDVHVNRSPVAGVIRGAHYQPGKFLNAMNPACAESNEQNTVTIDAAGKTVIFKQIAGLLARRVVFTKKIGDRVQRGERVGLIKFGSRTDVLISEKAELSVKVGDRVKGGSSIVAFLEADGRAPAGRATKAEERGRT